jgi:hypothetical protein
MDIQTPASDKKDNTSSQILQSSGGQASTGWPSNILQDARYNQQPDADRFTSQHLSTCPPQPNNPKILTADAQSNRRQGRNVTFGAHTTFEFELDMTKPLAHLTKYPPTLYASTEMFYVARGRGPEIKSCIPQPYFQNNLKLKGEHWQTKEEREMAVKGMATNEA